MPSPGKSGSVFFLSDDDRFLIKTVSHEEMLLLLKLIPAYYAHCEENPTTLLTRFFGVHRIKPLGSQSKVCLPCWGTYASIVHESQLHRPVAVDGYLAGNQKAKGSVLPSC
jgi:1-phosphatidylinositol-4-phosphate 5-kinase